MARLRDPDGGCPWDLAQTFGTIAPYTIEEAYEVADAIARGDVDDLREELGDLLLQIVFHARMAEEAGHFDFDDVACTITDKMIRRHPHVFGDKRFASEAERHEAWEDAKAAEREERARRRTIATTDASKSTKATASTVRPAPQGGVQTGGDKTSALSVLDGIARNLPALSRADKVQRRAARSGFDWPDVAPVRDKVLEELDEVDQAASSADADALEDEIGDLLFASVNLSRHHGVDPEVALRRATVKFERRFRRVEAFASAAGVALSDLDLAGLDALWNRAKAEEKLE